MGDSIGLQEKNSELDWGDCIGGFKLLFRVSEPVRCRRLGRNFMTIKPAQRFLSIACSVMLAACGGVPASNQLQFDNDRNGRFSGSAGSDWTPREIATQISGLVCGNGAIADFNVTVLPSAPDHTVFSGRCAAGAVTDSSTVQNQIVSRPAGASGVGPVQNRPVQNGPVQNSPAQNVTSSPVPVPTAGNRGGWDGSTPFVD